MLGGFKLVLYCILGPEIVLTDMQLTYMGMGGAFLCLFGRLFSNCLSRRSRYMSAETILSLVLLVQYSLIVLCKCYPNDDIHLVVAITLYFVTCFNYGVLISVMPALCQ